MVFLFPQNSSRFKKKIHTEIKPSSLKKKGERACTCCATNNDFIFRKAILDIKIVPGLPEASVSPSPSGAQALYVNKYMFIGARTSVCGFVTSQISF